MHYVQPTGEMSSFLYNALVLDILDDSNYRILKKYSSSI